MSPLHLLLDDNLHDLHHHHPDVHELMDQERKLLRAQWKEKPDSSNMAPVAAMCLGAFVVGYLLLSLASLAFSATSM